MVGKAYLRTRLEKGISYTMGTASSASKQSSGDRRLRELADEMDLFYFYALGKTGASYKVFAKRKKAFKIVVVDGGFSLCAHSEEYHPRLGFSFVSFYSKVYKTKKEALASIKQKGSN